MGADIHASNLEGQKPLHFVNTVEMVEFLVVEMGADIHAVDNVSSFVFFLITFEERTQSTGSSE